MPQTSPSVHICKYYFILGGTGGEESNSYWISTKKEGALHISSVGGLLSIPRFGGIISWQTRGWCLTGESCPKQHLPCLLVDVIPLFLLLPIYFFFFSRFPDSGLKMKRKSYCLITTAVTSIKCYLKVNGLHMLKTLELLTDHCKVSRIFNNLHVMRSPAIFGKGQAASPGSLHQGSQQKPLLHSSLQGRNRAWDGAKRWGPQAGFKHSRNPYFPDLKRRAGTDGGLLVFKGQRRVPAPLLDLSHERRHGKESTVPAQKRHNPDSELLCRGSLEETLPGNRFGAGGSKMLPRPGWEAAPAPLLLPHFHLLHSSVKGWQRKHPSSQHCPCFRSHLSGREYTCSQRI